MGLFLSKQRASSATAILVALTLTSGCAARKSSLTTRFVKPGEPTVNLDAPEPQPSAPSLGEYARQLRTLQANARTNVSLGTRLESTDPRLAQSLLRLAMVPTAETHRIVAAAYVDAGVRDYAFKHLRRALQLEPCDGQAFEGLARLWRDWGAPDLALGDAHRAVYCRPRSASAHNTLGIILIALGQHVKARHAFEVALQLDGNATFVLNNLCYLALQEGDGHGAERACERTLAVDPTMLAAQTNLALAYALQGDVARAERRLLDSPDAATGLYNVGILRMALNDYGEAATAFELAATTRPSLSEAARRARVARGKAAQREQ
jgi:Flp pilus assembly protein TadD